MKTLPKQITANEPIEIQIAPFGEFRATMSGGEDAEPQVVNQVLSPETLRRVAASYNPDKEVLVDVDHVSEAGGSTQAYGWISGLRLDERDGLLAQVAFNRLGAEAVSDRRYRYVSPVFQVDPGEGDAVTPSALLSLALTNQPNLPVRCVLNRATAAITQNVEPNPKEDTTMIAEKLGLAPEATEEEILAAIEALQTRLADAEAATLNAEAEAVADENKEKVENRAAFIKAYCANRELATQVLATLRAPAAPAAKTVNTAAAKSPTLPKDAPDPEEEVVSKFRAMPAGPEKDQFLAANRAVLVRRMR